MTKETGIIFSGDHPLKVLDGTKTMTRRTWGLEEINKNPDAWEHFGFDQAGRFSFRWKGGERILNVRCPYGGVGDRMWGRETYCHKADPITAIVSDTEFWYRASNPEVIKVDGDGFQEFRKDGWEASPWLSPMFMPRLASRILVEITELRVERVQEISEKDAKAEGASSIIWHGETAYAFKDNLPLSTYKAGFANLWDSLNKKRGYGWDRNVWVWPIGFRLLPQPARV
jgi:hypothetical protein